MFAICSLYRKIFFLVPNCSSPTKIHWRLGIERVHVCPKFISYTIQMFWTIQIFFKKSSRDCKIHSLGHRSRVLMCTSWCAALKWSIKAIGCVFNCSDFIAALWRSELPITEVKSESLIDEINGPDAYTRAVHQHPCPAVFAAWEVGSTQ